MWYGILCVCGFFYLAYCFKILTTVLHVLTIHFFVIYFLVVLGFALWALHLLSRRSTT
jgi:hypothetical protein